tara:strand:- start:357 stop:569 length:213 start_codon:yes stop_codon:yes gene_type:complete
VTKFLLVLQICSALHGNCLPQQTVDLYDSWYGCAKAGLSETITLLDIIGEDMINNNRIIITFSCAPQNEI